MQTASQSYGKKKPKLYILLSPFALFCLHAQYHSKIEVLLIQLLLFELLTFDFFLITTYKKKR